MERISATLPRLGNMAKVDAICSDCKMPTKTVQFLLERYPEAIYCAECEKKRELARRKQEREEAEQHRVASISRRLAEEVGFGVDHAKGRLSDFDSKVVNAAECFINEPEIARGLRLVGPPGTGKTRLAAAIAYEFLLRCASVEFYRSRELFRAIWDSQGDRDYPESRLLRDLASFDLLVLDDLSFEGRVSEAVVGALHEVIDRRLADFKPTIVSTNLPIAEIEKIYGAAIASRLGSFMVITLVGEDRRRRKS